MSNPGQDQVPEKLARLCWPDANVCNIYSTTNIRWPNDRPGADSHPFDPTTDANDWERVLGVLVERGLLMEYWKNLEYAVYTDMETNLRNILAAPLPDRCAAALVVLEKEHEHKETK